eukprot:TRINITY_DN6273_c0_g1_i1.p4 TRINITY_DN6273_c0_g1~~TRINITY_DN6273_c0_g1_i1.p4  ORF type:complete len:132 (+),score=17.75 TRINITY_DN6273_c0_g1_i1:162-557(+)
MATFAVDDQVGLGTPIKPCCNDANREFRRAWRQHGTVESVEHVETPGTLISVLSERNMLAEAFSIAFFEHYPLILTPDVIWLAIMQGLARHVDANAEQLRHKFVSFEGKQTLIVDRPDFEKGSTDNDWPGV